MKKLTDYGYSNDTVKLVEPVVSKVGSENNAEFAISFADLALDICNRVEQEQLTPKQADDCFTLIDLYISDNHPNFILDKMVKDVLFEGMILHDMGKKYGSKIETIRELANQLLEELRN